MARPQKEGLDYFPFDVGFFGDVIMLLKAQGGWEAVILYIYFLCRIYQKNGYYKELNEEELLTCCNVLGFELEKVQHHLNLCIKWSLFDKTLFDTDKVLTSCGIQRRFLVAMKDRAIKSAAKGRKMEINKDLLLLTIEDFKKLNIEGLYNVTKNAHFSENNEGISENNEGISEKNNTKEMKGNKDNPPRSKKVFLEDDVPFVLANEFKKMLEVKSPNVKIPESLQGWANDFDLLLRIDKRNEELIWEVMDWATSHSFWRANILSASKLRKQFDTLLLQKERDEKKNEHC